MNRAIEKAVKKLEQAEHDLREILKREQKTCPHKSVIHSKWKPSEWGSVFKARRLCLDCGLEEEAKHSGWGDNDYDFVDLKTGGFHKVVNDAWELYRVRIPQAAVNGHITETEQTAALG